VVEVGQVPGPHYELNEDLADHRIGIRYYQGKQNYSEGEVVFDDRLLRLPKVLCHIRGITLREVGDGRVSCHLSIGPLEDNNQDEDQEREEVHLLQFLLTA